MAEKEKGSKTRVGNWHEDQLAAEARLAELRAKRAAGTLGGTQRSANMTASQRELALGDTEDGTVRYGDRVVLRHMASGAALCGVPSQLVTPSVGVSPSEATAVAGAPDAGPSVRSAFIVLPGGGGEGAPAALGDQVLFGEGFVLESELAEPKQRLFSERVSLHAGMAVVSGQQAVTLRAGCEQRPYETLWKADPLDAEERLELEGTPVPANVPLLLRHAATNQCLACLTQHVVRSEFGVEHEITAHTHLTQHKNEGPENQWCLEMNRVLSS